jgi:uncharacterized membrane protein
MNQTPDHDLQLGSWIAAAALGAVAMYLLDPERGAARRAQSGRTLRELGRQGSDALQNVVQGIETRAGAAGAAVRSAAGLAGAVIKDAVEHAAGHATGASASAQPAAGSAGVANSAARHDSGYGTALHAPHNGAARWGAGKRGAARWGAGKRGAAMAGASALGLVGLLSARSPIALLLGLASLTLLARGATNRPLRSMLGGARSGQAFEIEKTIRIDAPPEQVYDLFANYENFPRYMSNVLEVRDLGNRRSHWVVKGPAGTELTWNAVLTEQDRPHRLAWESEPGAELAQAGSIRFEPLRGGTRVTVHLSYRPPAGMAGHAVASLLGRDPKHQMDDDLARMKTLVERGAAGQHGASAAQAGANQVLH